MLGRVMCGLGWPDAMRGWESRVPEVDVHSLHAQLATLDCNHPFPQQLRRSSPPPPQDEFLLAHERTERDRFLDLLRQRFALKVRSHLQ